MKRIGDFLIIIMLFLFIVVPFTTVADSLKGGYPACVTEELYKQIQKAAIVNNEKEWQYLLKNGCFALPAGMEITVLERDWEGVAKVRVFAGDEAIVLWTSSKNILRKK
ncbi:MAG: hypothetical protein KAS78_02660 [Candidatus Pacebacteria bacterium]|nr:hypothetical protein [Candidatus Paceibacterota bacterium]